MSLKFVPKDPIGNNTELVKMIGDKPLSEPMLTQVIDAYMRH